MNIVKFASLLAAASSGNDKPSFLRTGSGDADAMTCVNEGVSWLLVCAWLHDEYLSYDVLSHHHHHVRPFFDFILTTIVQVDAMCCLHTNGADTGGFEGCYTCVAKVIEDLVTDDATCESLANTVSRYCHTPTTLLCFGISLTRMLCCSSLSSRHTLSDHLRGHLCMLRWRWCPVRRCGLCYRTYGLQRVPQKEECPDLCPSLEHVGLNLASMIA